MVLLTAVGITKSNGKGGEKKERQCVTAVSESCTDNSDHSVVGVSAHNLLGFHLPLPISEFSIGKPHKGPTV